MLDAFTLRNSENHSRIVLVMDAEKAAGKHVSYKDYVNKSSQQGKLKELHVVTERHFDFVARDSHDAVISSKHKRYFSKRYENSMPTISSD